MATPLNKVLREARLNACLTLGQVTLETDIVPTQLCRLERHSNPGMITFVTVARLAKAYGVSLDEIAKEALE